MRTHQIASSVFVEMARKWPVTCAKLARLRAEFQPKHKHKDAKESFAIGEGFDTLGSIARGRSGQLHVMERDSMNVYVDPERALDPLHKTVKLRRSKKAKKKQQFSKKTQKKKPSFINNS